MADCLVVMPPSKNLVAATLQFRVSMDSIAVALCQEDIVSLASVSMVPASMVTVRKAAYSVLDVRNTTSQQCKNKYSVHLAVRS